MCLAFPLPLIFFGCSRRSKNLSFPPPRPRHNRKRRRRLRERVGEALCSPPVPNCLQRLSLYPASPSSKPLSPLSLLGGRTLCRLAVMMIPPLSPPSGVAEKGWRRRREQPAEKKEGEEEIALRGKKGEGEGHLPTRARND